MSLVAYALKDIVLQNDLRINTLLPRESPLCQIGLEGILLIHILLDAVVPLPSPSLSREGWGGSSLILVLLDAIVPLPSPSLSREGWGGSSQILVLMEYGLGHLLSPGLSSIGYLS